MFNGKYKGQRSHYSHLMEEPSMRRVHKSWSYVPNVYEETSPNIYHNIPIQ